MIVHLAKKMNNPETVCGVKRPLFTTIDKGLTTCSKCKKTARKLKSTNKRFGGVSVNAASPNALQQNNK